MAFYGTGTGQMAFYGTGTGQSQGLDRMQFLPDLCVLGATIIHYTGQVLKRWRTLLACLGQHLDVAEDKRLYGLLIRCTIVYIYPDIPIPFFAHIQLVT